jgi:hypothetical protein
MIYSDRSQERLETACIELQETFNLVILDYDNTIIEGHRGEAVQNEYFRTGKSKVRYPDSEHNESPSRAIDAAPYPIDWNDRERFVHFAGYVKGVGRSLGYIIRWGGDWDSDFDLDDQTFMDLVHFEFLGRYAGSYSAVPEIPTRMILR